MPGEAEITHFYDTLFRQENILRFDVSVNAVVYVAIIDCLQNLPNDAERCRQRHSKHQRRLLTKRKEGLNVSWLPFRMLLQLI